MFLIRINYLKWLFSQRPNFQIVSYNLITDQNNIIGDLRVITGHINGDLRVITGHFLNGGHENVTFIVILITFFFVSS